VTSPDPRPRDDERDDEDLGPHLQSELDDLLAGLDSVGEAQGAHAEADGEQPPSALPKARAESETADDLGPHLQARLHELLGEDARAEAFEHPNEPTSLEGEDSSSNDDEASADDDFAALEPLDALDAWSDEVGDLELFEDLGSAALGDLDAATSDAEVDAFLAEDGRAPIPDEEFEPGAGSSDPLAEFASAVEADDSREEYYGDGVIDAVTLDEYEAHRDRSELAELGFQDDNLGLSWSEESELEEEAAASFELAEQLPASEALLGEAPSIDPDPIPERADEADAEAFAGEVEAPSPEPSLRAEAAVDAVEDVITVETPAKEAPEAAEPFEEAPESLDLGIGLDDPDFAEPHFDQDEADLFGDDTGASNRAGDDLFDERPERTLDEALAAEDFDLDEDLFDFASLESGGGLAGDDALDIEEFLEAVGEGESFGSLDSDDVAALADDDDFAPKVKPAAAPREGDLASLDAELERAESEALRAPQPARRALPEGALVLAGGGRTWAWWLAGVAILVATNLAVATFLQADRDVARHNLEEARANLVEATAELAERRAADAAFLTDLRTPLALPEADPSRAFTQVHEALEVEDFALARRRLYALLATVDRRESDVEREAVEVQAAFMLADVDRLEADSLGERP
jgi:hypothetical protein